MLLENLLSRCHLLSAEGAVRSVTCCCRRLLAEYGGRRSEKWHQWQQQPEPDKVAALEKCFPEPQKKVEQIMHSVTSVDKRYLPELTVQTRLGGQRWRVYLTVGWPVHFKVVGDAQDPASAEHFAYLSACEMFKHLGLISPNGRLVDYKAELIKAHNVFHIRLREKRGLHITSCYKESMWSAKMTIVWPVTMETEGIGRTQAEAEDCAAQMVFYRLKSMMLLSKSNNLFEPRFLILPYKYSSSFQPHFQFYVDASIQGYGAYMYPCDPETSASVPVQWFTERWDEEVHRLFVTTGPHTAFLEFYALLAVVFTWKKKFFGKSVVAHSDSSYCVDVINDGYASKHDVHKKVFQVLRSICIQYQIHLQAVHVPRDSNQAADALSKGDHRQFFSLVPQAVPVGKKCKKLKWFMPLTYGQNLRSWGYGHGG